MSRLATEVLRSVVAVSGGLPVPVQATILQTSYSPECKAGMGGRGRGLPQGQSALLRVPPKWIKVCPLAAEEAGTCPWLARPFLRKGDPCFLEPLPLLCSWVSSIAQASSRAGTGLQWSCPHTEPLALSQEGRQGGQPEPPVGRKREVT